MSRLLSLIRGRPALGYSVGNLLNTVAMLMMLPAVMRADAVTGSLTAKGMLAGQLAAVLAVYSFPVVTPRSLSQHEQADGRQLLLAILGYQLICLMAAVLALSWTLPGHGPPWHQALPGLLVGFSVVLQWQWYHIGRDSFLQQALLLLASRAAMLATEGLGLMQGAPVFTHAGLFCWLLAGLVLVPVWPTCRILASQAAVSSGPPSRSKFSLLRAEFHQGRDLFMASLLSAVYTLGPSTLVAAVQPGGLVAVQQFDRLRNSISNLTGMLLSTVYPLLLKQARDTLRARYLLTERRIVLPALLIAGALLLSAPMLPISTASLMATLHLTWPALVIAMACAVSASASNVIALTFLHPLHNDRLYRFVIMAGALAFLAAVAVVLLAFQRQATTLAMGAAGLAEWLILIGLAWIARLVRKQAT